MPAGSGTSKRRIVSASSSAVYLFSKVPHPSTPLSVLPLRRRGITSRRSRRRFIWFLTVTGIASCFLVSTYFLGGRAEKSSLWRSDMNVVHVVQTRFMQFQPHLSQLGWARFYLFKTITLPSMLLQTNQDFLWIIRADPNLSIDLRGALMELVQDYPNIVFSGSNANPEGFKCSNCVDDLKDQLWSGSWDMIESYWEAAQIHTVLETRLDADDALWLGYIDWIQSRGRVDHWNVWCPENHMEWHSGQVWRKHASEKGSLIGLHLPHCVTAGLTWGYGVGTELHQTPTHKHELIHKEVPICIENITDQCLIRVTPPDQMPSVLRARTLTSAGMDHVLADAASETPAEASFRKRLRHSTWQNSQEELFEGMMFVFGISDYDMKETREFLEDHKAEIALEALKGQCTKGHSCKNETKLLLNNVLNESREGDSERIKE